MCLALQRDVWPSPSKPHWDSLLSPGCGEEQLVAIASASMHQLYRTQHLDLSLLNAGAKFTWTHLVKARANQSVTIPGLGPMGPQGGGRSPSDAGDEVRSFQLSVHRRHRPLVPQYIGAVAQQADRLTQEGRELKVGCSSSTLHCAR